MSKHNYSQYSKRKPSDVENKPKQTVTNAKPVEVKMEVERRESSLDRAGTTKVEEPVVLMGPIEVTPLPKTVPGVVANCAKLNVRSKPSITGEVLCVLNASSEIEIDVEKSVPDWFYICTVTGIEGYCMRQFIKADL